MSGWFGKSWGAPVCDPADHYPWVPGQDCILCEEEVLETDSGIVMPVWTAEQGGSVLGFAHKECNLRSVTGNEVHIRGLCSYTGECNELSKLTYRQQSLAVWEYIVELGLEPMVPHQT